MPNKTLVKFERHLGLGPPQACKVIGIAYATYAAYRNCSRELQPYHANHVADIMRLPVRLLQQVIKERI